MIKNQNYSIIQLGVGKYTKVFCMELEADKKVAVKVLKSDYEKNKFFQDQLIKEARVGMQIKHPGVRKVLDIMHDDVDNTYQIMMEYLDGYNMQEYIQNFGSIPEKQIIEWLKAILPALIETHRKGIVHGLLKPGNFILTPKGKLKICDFKGAYFESELFPENVDADDILFLSPEQIQHIGPISALSDIYTLGVTIYTLLSGRDPYDAKNADVDEIRLRILNEALPYVDKASLKINGIIQAATAKNPKERFPALESMLEELDGGEYKKKETIFEEDLFSSLDPNENELKTLPVIETKKSDNPAEEQKDQVSTQESIMPEIVKEIIELPEVTEEPLHEIVPEKPVHEKIIPDEPVKEDPKKDAELSLEDRAQAVWDRLGVNTQKEPSISKVPLVQTTDYKKSNEAVGRENKKEETKKQEAKKQTPFIPVIKTEVAINKPVVSVKQEVKEIPQEVIKKETQNPIDNKLEEKVKSAEIQPKVIISEVKKTVPVTESFLVEKEIVSFSEKDESSNKSKAGWFLPTLITLALVTGGYFTYDYYNTKNNSVIVTAVSNDTIVDQPVQNNLVTEPVNTESQAAVDSIIETDSSVSLLELEQAKIDKLKQLEVEKKRKALELEKEKEASKIDKTKIEILGTYVGDIAPYKYNNLIGFISRDGKVIKKPTYNEILSFNGGLAPVNMNGKWGFVNTSGVEVIKPKYNEIFGFSKGLAGVKFNGKWGFINTSGGVVVPFNYDVVTDYAEGLAGVRKNGKWGFVNKSGVEAIICQFDNAWSFKDGLAGVEKNNRWGFINKSGQSVIDLEYGQVNNFIEGFACVEKNGKYGFINKDGVEVIKCQYEAAKPFKNGTARVFDDGKWVYINKSGKCVRDCN